MGARDVIVDTLLGLDAMPADIDVRPYAKSLDGLSGTTLMVRVDQVRPGPVAGTRAYTIVLLLLTALTEPGPADDELDAALEDVLHALDTAPAGAGIAWTLADRAVFEDSFPAYQITTTVYTQKEAS